MNPILFLLVLIFPSIHASPVSKPPPPSSPQNLNQRDDYTLDAQTAFETTLNAMWSVFWNDQQQGFTFEDPACPGAPYQDASVWDVAVAGKAVTNSGDINRITQVINTLYRYQNSQGWFASHPYGLDVYTDDNAQVIWVFLDAYRLTQNQRYLDTATQVMHLIQSEWSNAGGIIWQVGDDYVASISTTEAALSAVKLYEYNQDATLLTFALSCLTWLDQHLTDPRDGFYYDGLDRNTWAVNRGKLTYTIGVAMSTYAYLYKYTRDLHYVLYAVKKAWGTLNSDVFLRSNGYWNNDLKYVHLLFAGFSDVITICGQAGYIPHIVKQALFIYRYYSIGDGHYMDYTSNLNTYDNYVNTTNDRSVAYEPDPDMYCAGGSGQLRRNLLNDASAAQIFSEIARVTQ
ncbi:hypothetical protein Cantr_04627 [Candida viswanathii]|uniref:Uncharacterized protein n=1 Tax=Candida viswanathii TaxID=5486 RepID=A0A367XNL5_9ASCO|nr:hypothetical protein Cantr_04627 [Candida viswanathii]